MIIYPYVFTNDIIKCYKRYLICKENKLKFIECINNNLNNIVLYKTNLLK